MIDVPDLFLPEFQRFWAGVIKMNPSRQTTHAKYTQYYAWPLDAWSPIEVVVDARGWQLPLAALGNLSLCPVVNCECPCCIFTMMEWGDVAVQPEPEVSVNCVKPQGLDNSPRTRSWDICQVQCREML